MHILETRQIRKRYGSPASEEVLRGIDLCVSKGEFLAITGPSGSGKSTLLHLLGGIDSPTSGQILLESIDFASLSDDQCTIMRRRRIGFIFQAFNLLPALSAQENVAAPLLLNGTSRSEARDRARRVLDRLGLTPRASHLPSELSGGEQQRVAIARALVLEPALLLADEPTGNLDSENGRLITALLRSLIEDCGQTLVMVTHDADIAQQAHRIVCLRDGMIESDTAVNATEKVR